MPFPNLPIPEEWDQNFFFSVLDAYPTSCATTPCPFIFPADTTQPLDCSFLHFLKSHEATFPYSLICSTRQSFRCNWYVMRHVSPSHNNKPGSCSADYAFVSASHNTNHPKHNLSQHIATQKVFPLPTYLDDVISLLHNADPFNPSFRANVCLNKFTTKWKMHVARFLYGYACLSTPESPPLTYKAAIKYVTYSLLALILADLDLHDCLRQHDFSSQFDTEFAHPAARGIQSIITMITHSVYVAFFHCLSSVATSSSCRSGAPFSVFLRQQKRSYPYSQIPPLAMLDGSRTLSSTPFLIKNIHNDTIMLLEKPTELPVATHKCLTHLMKAKQIHLL